LGDRGGDGSADWLIIALADWGILARAFRDAGFLSR
jgi:hypothetical protein